MKAAVRNLKPVTTVSKWVRVDLQTVDVIGLAPGYYHV